MAEFDVNNYMQDCLDIARGLAPKDTGNLAFNAITTQQLHNGFAIVYNEHSAFYVNFLEEGTKFMDKHVGFIETRTCEAIDKFLKGKLTNEQYSSNMDREALKQLSADSPARQERYLDSLGMNIIRGTEWWKK